MRVLIASVARQSDAVFLPHFETLLWQDADVHLSYHVTIDNLSSTAMRSVRRHASTWKALPKPLGAAYSVCESSHSWSVPAMHWLAREKQSLLDLAVREKRDAVLLVDTDLFLAPDVLGVLLEADKPIVAGVFQTQWQLDREPQPNVWLEHPYNRLPTFGDAALKQVAGLGACTLIRRDAIERGAAFLPLLEDSPTGGLWQGEDRHFSIRCNRLGIELWAHAGVSIWHCYRPSDAVRIPSIMATLTGEHHDKGQRGRSRKSGNAERSRNRTPPRTRPDGSSQADARMG